MKWSTFYEHARKESLYRYGRRNIPVATYKKFFDNGYTPEETAKILDEKSPYRRSDASWVSKRKDIIELPSAKDS